MKNNKPSQILIRKLADRYDANDGTQLSVYFIEKRNFTGDDRSADTTKEVVLEFNVSFENEGSVAKKIHRVSLSKESATDLAHSILSLVEFFERNHRIIPEGAELRQSVIDGITAGITLISHKESNDFIDIEITDLGRARFLFATEHGLTTFADKLSAFSYS